MRSSRAVVAAVVMAGCLPNFPDSQGAQGTTQDPGIGGGAGTTGGSTSSPSDGGSAIGATDGASPIAASGGGGGGPTDAGSAADLASSCIALTAAPSSGHHNAGQACAGCHDGANATLWTASGTLYNAVSGGSAIAGATIVLTDANNQEVRIVTSSNGNFYTQTALAYPVTARASGCPNDVAMVSKAASGDCNSCHNSTLRVHLP